MGHDQVAVRGIKLSCVSQDTGPLRSHVLGITGGSGAPPHPSVWLHSFSPVPGNVYLKTIAKLSAPCCLYLKRWWPLGYQALFGKTKVTSDSDSACSDRSDQVPWCLEWWSEQLSSLFSWATKAACVGHRRILRSKVISRNFLFIY